jgi:hypothetical protein
MISQLFGGELHAAEIAVALELFSRLHGRMSVFFPITLGMRGAPNLLE